MKLSSIPEKKFSIEFDDGSPRLYDPWETQEKLDKLSAESAKLQSEGQPYNTPFDNVRTAFGFLTEDQVNKSEVDPKPRTLTRHECMVAQTGLLEFIADLDVSKKARALMQKFSTSIRG